MDKIICFKMYAYVYISKYNSILDLSYRRFM